jgi:hypothetical protein
MNSLQPDMKYDIQVLGITGFKDGMVVSNLEEPGVTPVYYMFVDPAGYMLFDGVTCYKSRFSGTFGWFPSHDMDLLRQVSGAVSEWTEANHG